MAVFNGRDGEWRATVAGLGKRKMGLTALSRTRPQASGPDLDLIIALVKRARLETIVEKAAELGARRVRPVTTERTNADHTRVERLRAIATEAAEQTGRLDVPQVAEPLKLEKLLADWEPGRRLLFCDEAGDAPPVLGAGLAEGLGDPDRAGGGSRPGSAICCGLPYATPVTLGPASCADTAAISALTLWRGRGGRLAVAAIATASPHP